MSSLFLLPVPRDAQPPIDIWRRGAEAEKLIAELGDSKPLMSLSLVTESDDWKVKHISIYQNLLVYSRGFDGLKGPTATIKEVCGVYPLNFNKILYGETTLGMISKSAWGHLTSTGVDDKSISSSATSKIRYIHYIRLFDNPFEEISEIFYFKTQEDMQRWLTLLSAMKILNINFKTKYVVQGKLGTGAYSKVYLIKDIIMNKTFAAKAVLLEKFNDFDKAKDIIAGEIEAMHRLVSCPFTPVLYEVHQIEDIVYLVMDYIEGETLTNYIKKFVYKREMTEEIMHTIMRYILS